MIVISVILLSPSCNDCDFGDFIIYFLMIPPSNRSFLVNDLAPGREYDLCVLAVYDDGMTSLTATRVVGCVQFSTKEEAGQCQPLHTQFLGGTMIIIIGGIIVASVLVFIIILMIRYKVYSGQDEGGKARVSNVYSQTNGQQRTPAASPSTGRTHTLFRTGQALLLPGIWAPSTPAGSGAGAISS
uniref:Uncharacterized protein n=1 Tax=Leptobrachium leishanense TaxID=445787 RepID=A0A8C5PTB9_9ANUR